MKTLVAINFDSGRLRIQRNISWLEPRVSQIQGNMQHERILWSQGDEGMKGSSTSSWNFSPPRDISRDDPNDSWGGCCTHEKSWSWYTQFPEPLVLCIINTYRNFWSNLLQKFFKWMYLWNSWHDPNEIWGMHGPTIWPAGAAKILIIDSTSDRQ